MFPLFLSSGTDGSCPEPSILQGDTDFEVNVSRGLAPLDVWLMFALNLSKLGGTGLASAASGQEEPAFAP